jgi:TetR/AcrR family transcriptional regulator
MDPIFENKQKILNAARDLFLEKGLAGTSTSMIAKRAGVAKSLIHHHFGTKGDLWIEVKSSFLQSILEIYENLLRGDRPAREVIEKSFEQYFEFLRENPGHVRLLVWASLESEPMFLRTDQLTQQAVNWIERKQNEGILRRDLNAPALLLGFFNVIEGCFTARPDLKRSVWAGTGYSEEKAQIEYFRTVLSVFLEGALQRH